jgi:hypothetical protein
LAVRVERREAGSDVEERGRLRRRGRGGREREREREKERVL